MRNLIAIVLWATLVPQTSWALNRHAESALEYILQSSFTILPNSILRAGMEEVVPQEAELLKAKLKGLYKQCRTLERRQATKKRQMRRKRRRGRYMGIKPALSSNVKMVKTSKLAKMKNDHSNAVKRASEIEDYLLSVGSELSLYMLGGNQRQPFVNTAYSSLRGHPMGSQKSFSFVMKNLNELIELRLLPDVREIKASIQKSQYKDCRKKVKGYADA